MRCPKCKKGKVKQHVSIFVECPADCRDLSKRGIRKSSVNVLGVGWDMATWFCTLGCGFVKRLKPDIRKMKGKDYSPIKK